MNTNWTCEPCGVENPAGTTICSGCHRVWPKDYEIGQQARLIARAAHTIDEGQSPHISFGPSGLPQAKLKEDDGKPDFTILPYDALAEAADVLTWAIREYGKKRHSWREIAPHPEKGLPEDRCLKSLMRHLIADLEGERYDKDSGKQHLAHGLCQLLFTIAHRQMREKKIGPYAEG